MFNMNNTYLRILSSSGLFLGYTVLQVASIFLSLFKSFLKKFFGCNDDKKDVKQVEDLNTDHEKWPSILKINMIAIQDKIKEQDSKIKKLTENVNTLKENQK